MTARRCDACAEATLVPVSQLGGCSVLCGVQWADRDGAMRSALVRMLLAYCPYGGYVRKTGLEPDVMVYDPTMDTSLHHSPGSQRSARALEAHLSDRFR